MSTFPTSLAGFANDFHHCADCGYCVNASWPERGIEQVCATLQQHSPLASYSGRGFLAAARAWHEGREIDLDGLAARVFTCTTCGNCEAVCPIGLRPAQVGMALREALIGRGHAPPAITERAARLREARQPSDVAPIPAGVRPDVLYASGCGAAGVPPAEARATQRLLAAAGFEVGVVSGADACCGASSRELGYADDAGEALGAALARIRADRASGHRGEGATARVSPRGSAVPGATDGTDPAGRDAPAVLVTSSLACLAQWRTAAPPLHVKGVAEILWHLLDAGTLRLEARSGAPARVGLIDSCRERCGGQQGEGPGELLRAILRRLGRTVIAPGAAARYVVCCGAAGGMPTMAPAAAWRMARARLAGHGDPEVLVGLDPRCVAQVATARDTSTPPVFGLAEFVDRFFEAARGQP